MKVIDLFKNISDYDTYFGRNDGTLSLPDKIKVGDYEYKLDIDDGSYHRKDRNGEYTIGLLEDINLHNTYLWFNLEVEIIEEEKEIEEIKMTNDNRIVDDTEVVMHYITTNRKDKNIYIKKLNELIREVNKLKKEGK